MIKIIFQVEIFPGGKQKAQLNMAKPVNIINHIDLQGKKVIISIDTEIVIDKD